MTVLLVHNYYRQPGGEDEVFAAEAAQLRASGERVVTYTVHNDAIPGVVGWRAAAAAIWNGRVYLELRDMCRRERPRVAHFHNTFPMLSPAGWYAARAAGVPVVQTLHNYRLLCPAAVCFREGQVCEGCVGRSVPWPGVRHGCYRKSRAASGAVAAMLTAHRLLRTWTRIPALYIALTDFARDKFIQGGLPHAKLVVKPNFVHPDPGTGKRCGGFALFVGRLSPEKGIGTLLAAWERLHGAVPLQVVGDGPLAPHVAEAAGRIPGVRWLGARTKPEVYALMQQADALIVPSLWYESFPMVIAEAYACGCPVIASALGSLAALIDDRRTGLHFRPNDADDLAAKVQWTCAHPAERAAMGREARREFEQKYTADRHHALISRIYQLAQTRGRPTVPAASQARHVDGPPA